MNAKTRRIAILPFILLTLVSGAAHALDPVTSSLVQSVTLQVPAEVTEDAEEPPVSYLGINGCQTNINQGNRITATFNAAEGVIFDEASGSNRRFVDAYVYSIDAGGNAVTCPSETCTTLSESDGEVTVGSSTISISLPFDEFTGLTSADECADFDREYFIRVELRETGPDDSTTVNHETKVVIDTVRPPGVAISEVIATKANLDLTWELPDTTSDIQSYTIYWSRDQFTGGVLASSISNIVKADTLSANSGDRVSGTASVDLEAGETVWVSIASRDKTSNESLLPTPISAEVVETLDFWEHYKASGGSEPGGCSSVDGAGNLGAIALLLLGLIGLRRRREATRIIAGVATAGALMVAMPQDAAAESPTFGHFELRFGNYYPGIDDEFSGASKPFQDVFGGGDLFFGEIEMGVYFYQGIGKAGTALHLGYSSVSANALSDVEVSDETSFMILPIRGSLFYRFDHLAQKTSIPLAFVAKAGLDWVYWSIEGTDGDVASTGGADGNGAKWGWHAGLAAHFLLDVIDSSSAALFDLNWGVNNSYLFAEYLITRVDDFGGEGFDLSDDMWLFGVSFEY